MKGPLDRTKVVVRHLPPTILQSNFVEHVDSRFSERYRWLCFRPGKSSHKHLIYSRAYIEFNKAEDVIEFAEFFNGHVFVNEKGNVHYILEAIHLGLDASDQKHMSLYSGTQFKAIVEYAPSQRVPKQWSKKDGREGTILKDPEYLEFLDFLAKPVENLPSAEIQLERKEAERAGAPKDVPIITPLMDYVRQKRAAKGGARRTVLNGKSSRRVSGMSSRSPMSSASRRGSEKRRSSTTMYVMRDNSKGISSKEKSTYLLVPKQDDQQLAEKSVNVAALSESLEAENGSGSTEMGKKKILLLKGKEKEILNVSGGSLQQNATSPDKSAHGSAPIKNHHREASGRIIRSILLNRETHQNQPSSGSQSEPRILFSSQDREKKPPRPPSMQSLQKDANGVPEDKVVGNDSHAVHTEKQERRTRNKDRPDRVVWAPPRRSDGSHGSDESLSSSTSQTSQAMDSAVTQLEAEQDVVSRGGEYRRTGNGRNNYYSVDNGSFRHGSRRGSAYTVKDVDGSSVIEGKLSKRGSSGYGSHEKQVWVQKSSSGS